jgi:predicted ATPase
VQPASFIGRQQEVQEVERLLELDGVRLLTLTGPGGIGKTRLALRAAERVQEGFSDGVVFISLAPLSDPGLVVSTIASGLTLTEARNRPILETLIEHLQEKRLLMMLDNVEHLLPAAAVIARLIAARPSIKVLVTSRAVLRLAAEQEYSVPPLPVPVPGHVPALDVLSRYDAIRLFLQRAQATLPHFQLTEETAPAVAEICARLDGLPLAIELAAARLRFFPLQALLARLSGRLQLLTGGPRDVPARLQTLRNTMEWSYRLLSPDDRALFDRLSVFAGGCTLEAAESVCLSDPDADLLPGLTTLLEHSLVQEQGEETPRFVMLETIREYAQERLEAAGEAEDIRQRHAEWVLQFTEEAAPQIRGPDQVTWLRRVDAERNNVRAAVTWARDRGEIEIGLGIASALERYFFTHGLLSEGLRWLEDLLRLDDTRGGVAGASVRGNALVQASRMARNQGDPARAAMLAEEVTRLARSLGDKHLLALGLAAEGFAVLLTDVERALALCEEALALHTEVGDARGAAETLGSLGMIAALQGDYQRAVILVEESLVLWQRCGDVLNTALAHLKLGDLAFVAATDLDAARGLYEQSLAGLAQDQGDLERAEALAEQSLTFLRTHGERHITGWATRILGEVVLARGDIPRALNLLQESLQLARLVGDVDLIATALEDLGQVAYVQGQLERSVQLYSAAMALREATRVERPPQRKEVDDHLLATLRHMLGEERFLLEWSRGRAMSQEDAIAYALADPEQTCA